MTQLARRFVGACGRPFTLPYARGLEEMFQIVSICCVDLVQLLDLLQLGRGDEGPFCLPKPVYLSAGDPKTVRQNVRPKGQRFALGEDTGCVSRVAAACNGSCRAELRREAADLAAVLLECDCQSRGNFGGFKNKSARCLRQRREEFVCLGQISQPVRSIENVNKNSVGDCPMGLAKIVFPVRLNLHDLLAQKEDGRACRQKRQETRNERLPCVDDLDHATNRPAPPLKGAEVCCRNRCKEHKDQKSRNCENGRRAHAAKISYCRAWGNRALGVPRR